MPSEHTSDRATAPGKWKRYLSHSLHIFAVSPEPTLLAHTIYTTRGSFRQRATFLAFSEWLCMRLWRISNRATLMCLFSCISSLILRTKLMFIGMNPLHTQLICITFEITLASLGTWSLNTIYGLHQANLVLIAYASSEGSGEPAYPRSLARTSAARSYKQWVKRNLQTESQIPGLSEWLGMRS